MEIVQESSVDSLASLEERITKAVTLITDLRSQNSTLVKRVAQLEEQLKGSNSTQHQLESSHAVVSRERDDLAQKLKQHMHDLDEIRGERKEVRTRIEKLLSQLDLLSAS